MASSTLSETSLGKTLEVKREARISRVCDWDTYSVTRFGNISEPAYFVAGVFTSVMYWIVLLLVSIDKINMSIVKLSLTSRKVAIAHHAVIPDTCEQL